MYKEFLDPEMMYSSALYPADDSSLNEAQLHKLHTICERLELTPGQTLLEVGTGWGALAIYAAKHYGVHVTTTTISDAQFDYAQDRVKQEGLEEQITLLKQDYRLLTGEYDRVATVKDSDHINWARHWQGICLDSTLPINIRKPCLKLVQALQSFLK